MKISSRNPSFLNVLFCIGCLAFAVLAPGCSSDDGAGPVTPVADTTPPGVSSVTPVDVNHIQIAFDEVVGRSSAERTENYRVVDVSGPPAPGDTLLLDSAALSTDGRTVTITTVTPMQAVPYDVSVRAVDDVSGNRMSAEVTRRVTGNTTADVTPPGIVLRSPWSGATGVGVNQSVIVQFSERMSGKTLVGAFSWTHAGGRVPFTLSTDASTNTFVFTPALAMALNTRYTITLTGATDVAGNPLPTTTWSFTTMPMLDVTRPIFVSSNPGDGAVGVARDVTLRLTFSEPIDQLLFEPAIAPDISNGVPVWQGGTVTFDPDSLLLPDTQYLFVIPPDVVRDMAGNIMSDVVTIQFTTAPAFAAGSFSGTIAGDPASTTASDPAGCIVIAANTPDLGDSMLINGTGVAGTGGVYAVGRLGDGDHWPVGFLDSNGDGILDPEMGDAIGAYGVDFTQRPLASPDSVVIAGGNTVTNVDFQLYDPVAASGRVVYTGQSFANQDLGYYVGIFDTTGFDISTGIPDPDFVTGVLGILVDADFTLGELADGVVPSVYYIGTYLDVNDNTSLDPGVDLAAFYEVGGSPVPFDMTSGGDATGVLIVLDDSDIAPVPGRGAASWTAAARNTGVSAEWRRLLSRVRPVLERYRNAWLR
ncbi:MAG: Ig-like domain-containing protein [Candidatus Krumholzibacteriia bacterium]